ncbi:MAG: methionine gamma-lyase family protein [Syntrophomonadaceae bacterium]
MNAAQIIRNAERNLAYRFQEAEETAYINQARVLEAFREMRVREFHFHPSSGYGYSDAGREVLENLYASIFASPDALVRPQLVSGTHAIASCMSALLQPGDELLSAAADPYDTLANVIKGKSHKSLVARGIHYAGIALTDRDKVDIDGVARAVGVKTRMVLVQRSRGYQLRPAIPLEDIKLIIEAIKGKNPNTIVLVDNCYGEFVAGYEPPSLGADLTAGSLIKNPGGGLAVNGGYICGSAELVEEVAWHITAPGLGKELGSIPFDKRYLFMGLFQAPHIVLQAIKGAMLLALVFAENGFSVSPGWDESRSDIVQAIHLKDAGQVQRFCQIVQRYSPIDSDVTLEYAPLPGYSDGVVMAAGTFIQGSSIELSCDAPLREPYCAFLQGGLSYQHCRYVIEQLVREFII